jgi:hypothetical protein
MTTPQFPVLEFPEMLYGHTEDIIRKVRTKGQRWAREYLETGAFSLPRRMLPVPPGELLVMDPVPLRRQPPSSLAGAPLHQCLHELE